MNTLQIAERAADAEWRHLDFFEQILATGSRHTAWHMTRAIRLQGPLNPAQLEQAIHEVDRRIPLLQTRIDAARWAPRLIRGTGGGLPSMATLLRRGDDDWQISATAELHRGFDESGPLWRARLLHEAGQERAELILTFHHAICDGVSVNRLVRWILQAYGAIARGESCDGIVPTGAAVAIRRAMGSSLAANITTLRRAAGLMRGFWHARRRCHLKRDCHDTIPVEQRRTRPRFAVLDDYLSAELIRCCQRERASVHSALCTAMLLAAQDDTDPADGVLTCFSNIDRRRRDLKQFAEYFGCLAYYIVTEHQPFSPHKFWEAARAVSAQTTVRIHAHGRPPAAWLGPLARPFLERILHSSGMGRRQTVGVSYAGRFSAPCEAGVPAIRGMFSMTGQHGIGPDVMLLATSVAGRFQLTLCFVEPLLGVARQERFVERFLHHLAAACAEDRSVTISPRFSLDFDSGAEAFAAAKRRI